ncbi:MAG: hypothetical protein K6T83_01675 [Alicyclobacillus sp.]|nr:hypothetical protein [Alicyclobacillus sp.]
MRIAVKGGMACGKPATSRGRPNLAAGAVDAPHTMNLDWMRKVNLRRWTHEAPGLVGEWDDKVAMATSPS